MSVKVCKLSHAPDPLASLPAFIFSSLTFVNSQNRCRHCVSPFLLNPLTQAASRLDPAPVDAEGEEDEEAAPAPPPPPPKSRRIRECTSNVSLFWQAVIELVNPPPEKPKTKLSRKEKAVKRVANEAENCRKKLEKCGINLKLAGLDHLSDRRLSEFYHKLDDDKKHIFSKARPLSLRRRGLGDCSSEPARAGKLGGQGHCDGAAG